jgi:hypothetical protein
MADKETDCTFALDTETGGVAWYLPKANPELTEQQAMVIAVARLEGSFAKIADALYAIADAIGRDE